MQCLKHVRSGPAVHIMLTTLLILDSSSLYSALLGLSKSAVYSLSSVSDTLTVNPEAKKKKKKQSYRQVSLSRFENLYKINTEKERMEQITRITGT